MRALVAPRQRETEPLWLEWLTLVGGLAFCTWLLGVRGVWGLLLGADPTGLTLVITAVNVAWLLAGAGLTRFFRDPRSNRIINMAFALSLVGSVALAFVV